MKKEVLRISINKIVPNTNQPRLDFYDESIKGLAESIKENGLLQPVVVRKNGPKFELIAGERRYRACLLNDEKYIEAILVESTDEESAALALVENMQRENLNAIEQAIALQKIIKNEKITQRELAKRFGYKQATIANKIRLLKLPDYIKKAVSSKTITERHARAMIGLSEEKMEKAYLSIINNKLTVSEAEKMIKNIENNTVVESSPSIDKSLSILDEAYQMCKKAGIDSTIRITNYKNEVKVVIDFKK